MFVFKEILLLNLKSEKLENFFQINKKAVFCEVKKFQDSSFFVQLIKSPLAFTRGFSLKIKFAFVTQKSKKNVYVKLKNDIPKQISNAIFSHTDFEVMI